MSRPKKEFLPAASVIPSFSQAPFQHGILADVGGGWGPPTVASKHSSAIRFTNVENLQPLGYGMNIKTTSHHSCVFVPPRDGDFEGTVHIVLCGNIITFCKVDLFRRHLRSVPPPETEDLPENRPERSFVTKSSPVLPDSVATFERTYEQECSLDTLWTDNSGYRASRPCVVSGGRSTKTLLASPGIPNQKRELVLDLLDVWNNGKSVAKIQLENVKGNAPYASCFHAKTNRVFVSTYSVVGCDLEIGKAVWNCFSHTSVINPRNYELFSLQSPPASARAIACQDNIFVGAYDCLSMLDVRTAGKPLLQRKAVGYIRQIAISERIVTYLHGPTVSVFDLRMMKTDIGFRSLHESVGRDGCAGDIVSLPNEREKDAFISVGPQANRGGLTSGMTKWCVSKGRAKILKQTNWPALGACYIPTGDDGSAQERVEVEERIRFSLSSEGLLQSGVTLSFGGSSGMSILPFFL